ncbi:MAG: hypothetical protein ACHQT8_04295 [Chlamydiales bacterium]
MTFRVTLLERSSIDMGLGAATGALSSVFLTDLPWTHGLYIGGVSRAVTVLTGNLLGRYLMRNCPWAQVTQGRIRTLSHFALNLCRVLAIVAGLAATILGASLAGYSLPLVSTIVVSGSAYLVNLVVSPRIISSIENARTPLRTRRSSV